MDCYYADCAWCNTLLRNTGMKQYKHVPETGYDLFHVSGSQDAVLVKYDILI